MGNGNFGQVTDSELLLLLEYALILLRSVTFLKVKFSRAGHIYFQRRTHCSIAKQGTAGES